MECKKKKFEILWSAFLLAINHFFIVAPSRHSIVSVKLQFRGIFSNLGKAEFHNYAFKYDTISFIERKKTGAINQILNHDFLQEATKF
jgi:hypothetical protein